MDVWWIFQWNQKGFWILCIWQYWQIWLKLIVWEVVWLVDIGWFWIWFGLTCETLLGKPIYHRTQLLRMKLTSCSPSVSCYPKEFLRKAFCGFVSNYFGQQNDYLYCVMLVLCELNHECPYWVDHIITWELTNSFIEDISIGKQVKPSWIPEFVESTMLKQRGNPISHWGAP